jgi:hypothetical protein
MMHRAPFLRITLLGLVVLAAATCAAAEDALCEALDRVVEAAGAGNSFADLTGSDAGTHMQASERLPDAAWCLVRPNDRPATFRCLMANEDRYQGVFKKQNKHADRVAACLGDGWTRVKKTETGYLREISFSHGNGVEVIVLATDEVAEEKGWQRYRIVLVVRAPAS